MYSKMAIFEIGNSILAASLRLIQSSGKKMGTEFRFTLQPFTKFDKLDNKKISSFFTRWYYDHAHNANNRINIRRAH